MVSTLACLRSDFLVFTIDIDCCIFFKEDGMVSTTFFTFVFGSYLQMSNRFVYDNVQSNKHVMFHKCIHQI